MTQAHLELADHDIEASAQLGKEVLKTARVMHSKTEEENVKSLYYTLHEVAPNNPYVNNLGVEPGIF